MGARALDKARRPLMLLCIGISSFSIVFRVLAMCALDKRNDGLAMFNWASGTIPCNSNRTICAHGDIEVQIGILAVRIEDGAGDRRIAEWGDIDCSFNSVRQSEDMTSGCTECRTAATTTIGVLIMSLVSSVLQLKSDLQRLRRQNDHNCAKVWAIAMGINVTVNQVIALAAFKKGCVDSLPVGLSLGVGWYFLLIAVTLKCAVIVIHILVPAPRARWAEDAEEDPAPAGMWPGTPKSKAPAEEASL